MIISALEVNFSVVTVIETDTETAVLCLCIDGSVFKWSSFVALNVNSRLSYRPLVSPAGVIVGIKGEIAGGGGPAPPRVRTVGD